MKLFRLGSRGNAVRDIRSRLVTAGFLDEPSGDADDAVFTERTERAVRAFQQKRGLIADGIVGPDTWQALVDAGRALGSRLLYLHEPPLRGDDILELKRTLNALGFFCGKENVLFDHPVAVAVEQFQRNSGLPRDGIVGASTVEALKRLSRVTRDTSVAFARFREEGLPTRGLSGRRIMLDAGHGFPPDPGLVGAGGLHESEAAETIVESLGNILLEEGVQILHSRRRGEYLAENERARVANEQDVDLVLSIHMNSSTDPTAGGASCYYFGTDKYHSPYGYRLANHIQDELISALGCMDCRVHRMALPILSDTRMPVVIVEPAFLSNPEEERLLHDPDYIGRISTAILRGMRSYFSGIKSAAE